MAPADRGVRLAWKVVFGLTTPPLPGWPRVRAAQAADFVRLFPVICLANIFNALALAFILWPGVPRWELLAWLGAILGTMGSSARLAERSRRDTAERVNGDMLRAAAVRAVLLGALWIVPPIRFVPVATIDQQFAICMVTAAIMASAVLTTATLPPIMLIFLLITGAGFTAMFIGASSPLLALLPLIYAGCLGVGGIAQGRAFLLRAVAEVQLQEKSEVVSLLLREFETKGADWLWEVDAAKRLTHVSAGFARAVQLDAAMIEAKPLLQVLAGKSWDKGDVPAELRTLVDRMNQREGFADLQIPVSVAGQTRWWSLSAQPRFDDRGAFDGFRGVGSDITEQRRSADEIDRLARIDALTGLANRRHFSEELRKAMTVSQRERGRCALLLIDLDKFKPVNDTLGHPVGDGLLRQVAERLTQTTGTFGLCGRLGGDEFAIMVPVLDDIGDATALGEAIVDAVRQPFDIEGNVIGIGASIGIAVAPRDGRSMETLMRNADLALYRAKDDGRGVCRRYEPEMFARFEKRRAIELALREAIDTGQFHLVYQPVVATGTGAIDAFEALLRWNHPTLGDVPPSEFIAVAEEARLSSRIGEWVLRTACADAAQWPSSIRVAVNLTAEQLHDPQLSGTIFSALSHAGLPPQRLELELSEEIFLRDQSAALPILDRLRTMGLRLALDDFGTGYTALGYVRYGRFNTIKIDNAFVRGAAANEPESLAIVRAVVAMAGPLDLVTVAEGAETEAQLARIRDIGCSGVQGYHIAPPVSAEEALALVAQRRQDAG